MRTRSAVLATLVVTVVAFLTMSAREARANYEYSCGGHRDARCHEEPRADTACYTNACYGRCGPACGWTILGNTYTSACSSHDGCVKNRMCNYGDGTWSAHYNCKGGLPSAVGSFVQTHWNYFFQWAKDTASGIWKKIRSCCN